MRKKDFLAVVVLLSLIAIITHFSELAELGKRSKAQGCFQIFPERLKSFVAACLWEKADRLMHEGPVISKQGFVAGSYAGNTDIVPLLKMVIALCPEQTAPYRLLATNYAYHLNMGSAALDLLNTAKINCAENPNNHEIYAAEALIRLHTGKNEKDKRQTLEKAVSLFEDAIVRYKTDKQFPDPVFTIENYIDVKDALQKRLSKGEQQIDTDQKAFDFFSQKEAEESVENSFSDHDCHCLNEENLLSLLFKLVMKAGFITCLIFILYRRGSLKSF